MKAGDHEYTVRRKRGRVQPGLAKTTLSNETGEYLFYTRDRSEGMEEEEPREEKSQKKGAACELKSLKITLKYLKLIVGNHTVEEKHRQRER